MGSCLHYCMRAGLKGFLFMGSGVVNRKAFLPFQKSPWPKEAAYIMGLCCVPTHFAPNYCPPGQLSCFKQEAVYR